MVTPHAITNVQEFRAHLTELRARGWEYAEDDVTLGLTALAVPILDSEEHIVCAFSMAGLAPQMRGTGAPRHPDRMLTATTRVATALGC
jgi:IclR family KDG regulon transcriptional repressor